MSDQQSSQEIPETFNVITTTKNSIECQILVHVVSDEYNEVENDHNLQLLSGIFMQEISKSIALTSPSHSIKKNGATVILHFDSHVDCDVTSNDVDLLLLFIPVKDNALHDSFSEKIRNITETRGESIWNNAVIILSRVDVALDDFRSSERGNDVIQLKSWLGTWKSQALQAAKSDKVQVLLAGRQDQPDLPQPHEKWFSQLWVASFHSLKVRAMPAMLKFAQGRVSNSVKSKDIEDLPFHQQPIEVKENSVELPTSLKVGLGIGGGGAIAGATAAGATTGALIGALAIGIPTFGIAAGLGLLIGGVVGGGVGGGIASAAVGGAYVAAKNQAQKEISALDLKIYYAELLTRIPKISAFLSEWAGNQVNCRIVVTGINGEGVSTVAAALAGQNPRGRTSEYQRQVESKGNLSVHDFQSFKQPAEMEATAKRLVKIAQKKDLLVFCVPMTSAKEEFVRSSHGKFLQKICSQDKDALSNIVITLTHANEMRAKKERCDDAQELSFQQFFNRELEEWKTQVHAVLIGYPHGDDFNVKNVPVVPVGNVEPSIDLSDDGAPSPATQYYWPTEFRLQAMPATKPEGLPALVRINKKQAEQRPNEYSDLDRAHELIVEAQCSMFSRIGLKEKKNPGQAIGLILGTKEEQNW